MLADRTVLVGRYTVLRLLGQGGMGFVYLVEDAVSGEQRALKTCEDPDEVAQRRFAREVRIMATIQHANVMPVLDQHMDAAPSFFVMPLGIGSLHNELAPGLDEEQVLSAFEEICRGVQAIHTAGCAHRDIKPLNVVRFPDGHLAVSDMGLAKFETRDTTILTRTTQFLGTEAYCAPEQYTGSRDTDARTDIFQLGKTLYHMLTGQNPLFLERNRIAPGLYLIIERATQMDPAQRFGSVGALLDAVHAYQAAKNPDASPSEAFEALLNEARLLRDRGEFRSGNIEALIAQLMGFAGDADGFVKQVHRVPPDLWVLAVAAMPIEIEAVVRTYADAVNEIAGNQPFEFAEHVAWRARQFIATDVPPTIKMHALRAVLVAAVALNRYAAMDAFDAMLVQCRGADAIAVAAMLDTEFQHYRQVADRISRDRLDPAIRPVFDRAHRNS